MNIEKTLCPGCGTELSCYTYEINRRRIAKLCDMVVIEHKSYGNLMYGDDRDVIFYCNNCGREFNEYLYQVPGKNNMLDTVLVGAIIGDIVGSPYEFNDNNIKTKDFQLISEKSRPTDDSVMTIAIAEGLLISKDQTDDEIKETLIDSVKKWGRKYPAAGYGARFSIWLKLDDRSPYQSYGNGSAMRVSSAGWLAESIYDARRLGRLTAEITHNHIEGIKGAEAVASAIFLARQKADKDFIKKYIEVEFGYELNRTCDEIRENFYHVEDCMRTVPEAITAFLEGKSFIDCIKTAVSLGGDSDTIAAITGSIAEAFYGVTSDLKPVIEALPEDMKEVINAFNEQL